MFYISPNFSHTNIIHEVFILIISYVTRVISHAFQKTLHMLSVLITQI